MTRMARAPALLALIGCLFAAASAEAQGTTIGIVAAENFYGDVARQIGGPHVRVTSILSSPDRDPHLFEASVSAARALAQARIVISNGLDYDAWAARLLSASKEGGRASIVLADLLHKKPGDNPHLWYDPAAMRALAAALSSELIALDPRNESDYRHRLASFEESLSRLDRRIGALREKYQGTAVAATEPVFGYMAAALGLAMRNQRFQLAIMNGTEPRVSDLAAFEDDLRKRRVRVLIYNSQTSGALTERLTALARSSGVPVVGVSETEPAGRDYQDWMTEQLQAIEKALSGGVS